MGAFFVARSLARRGEEEHTLLPGLRVTFWGLVQGRLT
jgi:hypothetical protein